MKVSLISPYSEISSIGLRTLSSYLKSHGVSTRLIFLPLQRNFYSREEFLSYPDNVINMLSQLLEDVDLIGFSLMSNYYNSIKDLSIKLKRKLPGKPILWGGIHPTVVPEECLEIADYICIGEGERPCLELCKNLSEGKSAKTIPAI